MHLTARSGNRAAIELLLENGAQSDIDAETKWGATPLSLADKLENKDAFDVLKSARGARG